MALAAGTGGRKRTVVGSDLGVKASPRITRSFGESDGQVGTGIDGTLETSGRMIGMHPKVIGITAKLIPRAIKTVELAEVLR